MKKTGLFVSLVLTLIILVSSAGNACGDKFLVKHGTLTKARCMAGIKMGTILLYRDPNTKAAESALGKDLERTLVNSGNTVRVVETSGDFENALRNEEFDVVVSGYAAAQSAERILKNAGKTATLIPVVEKENESEVHAAKERFGSVIKDTDRTSTKSLIINEVLTKSSKTS
jgi:hypothetical protein